MTGAATWKHPKANQAVRACEDVKQTLSPNTRAKMPKSKSRFPVVRGASRRFSQIYCSPQNSCAFTPSAHEGRGMSHSGWVETMKSQICSWSSDERKAIISGNDELKRRSIVKAYVGHIATSSTVSLTFLHVISLGLLGLRKKSGSYYGW